MSSVNYRFMESRDIGNIRRANRKMKDRARKIGWYRHIDFDQCERLVLHKGISSIIVNETYLVCYDTGVPWYSKDTMLQELLVLKINEGGGTFSDIPKALQALAKELGCKGILTGTALANSNRALSRLYQREGFTPEAMTLYKPVE